MKKLLITLFICSFAIFNTGCEALEEALKSQSGCMLEDAPNYNSASLLPCTSDCIDDQTGSNCCCELIVYGCMDDTAPNYSGTANSPCVEVEEVEVVTSGNDTLITEVEVSNACCLINIPGCMDPAASNTNFQANVEDNDQCTYETAEVEVTDEEGTTTTVTVTYGCMNSDACNYIEPSESTAVYGDCNAENADIAGSEWVQNDDCCDLNKNSICYLDLNYNGYYEEVNSTVSTCNCGELGVGWVSADEVVCSDDNNDGICDDVEIQGCTSVINTGFTDLVEIGTPCAEYDPNANVDNGGCCLIEFNFDDFADFDSSAINFMGVFNVDFTYGMLNEAGNCEADPMMMEGGPAIAQITLGPPDQSGVGQMQYFEQFVDTFSTYLEWEYHAESITDEMECQTTADSLGTEYWFCGNWGFEYESCEDLWKEDCNSPDRPDCHWEESFCYPAFEGGVPCETFNDITGCEDNGCKWDNETQNCVYPVNEPWRDCDWLSEWECENNPNCETAIDFGGGGDGTGDDCFLDCLDYFPDDPGEVGECELISIFLNSGCLDNCDDDIKDMFKIQEYMCVGVAEGYCSDVFYSDGEGECEPCGGSSGCGSYFDQMDCEDNDCTWLGWENGPGCGDTGDCGNYDTSDGTQCSTITSGEECMCEEHCRWDPTGDNGGSCNDDGPPECATDCEGFSEDLDPESNSTVFCEWITGLGEVGDPNICYSDCNTEDGVACMAYMCDGCLDADGPWAGDCGMLFYDNDGMGSDTTSSIIDKLIKTKFLSDSRLSRGNNDCDEGLISDCSGDGDCCEETWLGDGFADCQDQEWGCDLSCYDNDGGDCEEGGFGSTVCIPIGPCFDYDESTCYDDDSCFWATEENGGDGLCIPEPSSGPKCDDHDNQMDCIDEDICHWIFEGPNGEPAFCAPTPCQATVDENMDGLIDDCNARPECVWDMPDWVDPWAGGACFKYDPCAGLLDEQACNNNPNHVCAWNWDEWYCYDPGEEQQGGGFCDCIMDHTKSSCDAIQGNWALPDWAEDCEDCDWVEYECWVPMEEQDCFHEYDDPCAQFFGGGNEQTDWNEGIHTCTKSFSFFDAGTWGLGSGCLELDWNDQPDPECTDDPLQTENTCYCFDCQWNFESGSCADWTEDSMGRTTKQSIMHDYQEMIYELSGSSGNGECIDYYIMDGGIIQLIKINPEYGDCQIIMLTPVSASDS